MSPTRLLFVAPCVAVLVCGAGAAVAAKRSGRHAGHVPRVSTATYTFRARPHARVLRMAGDHGTRYAQAHHYGLTRGG